MFYNIYNVNPVNMKKEFQFKYSFYFPFLNTTNRIHINSGGFYMKHHNMSSITAKRKQHNSNSLIMMRGNMNHTISTNHYSLIKSFLIFFLNFLDVNICAKNISFAEFFSILNV